MPATGSFGQLYRVSLGERIWWMLRRGLTTHSASVPLQDCSLSSRPQFTQVYVFSLIRASPEWQVACNRRVLQRGNSANSSRPSVSCSGHKATKIYTAGHTEGSSGSMVGKFNLRPVKSWPTSSLRPRLHDRRAPSARERSVEPKQQKFLDQSDIPHHRTRLATAP